MSGTKRSCRNCLTAGTSLTTKKSWIPAMGFQVISRNCLTAGTSLTTEEATFTLHQHSLCRNCLTAGTSLTTVRIFKPLLKRLRRCPTTEVLFASVFVMKTIEILFLRNPCASFI